MSRIFNTIGSLTTLKSHLEESNIYDFKSLKEVIDFQNSYAISRQQLISHHKNLIEEEKKILNVELIDLDTAIETQKRQTEQLLTDEIDKLKNLYNVYSSQNTINIFQKITHNLRLWNYNRKIKSERKKAVIDNLNSFIYGALGEQMIVKALEDLSDEYFLINDFSVSFAPAIYNRQDNDYIKSVQIDHILVGPSGIFLIETKNWSEKSLENMSLRSPVQQIRRTSFVLFKLLNNEMSNYHLRLDRHHWGDKKISIKNLIVMTNTKPQEEFQFVKVLTLNELLGYINYFKPTFSINETQRIADFILKINEQKVIESN